jgi:hypothetical protein
VLKFFVLGAIVAAVFAASFGPFILAGQLEQVSMCTGSFSFCYGTPLLHLRDLLFDLLKNPLAKHIWPIFWHICINIQPAIFRTI